MANFDIEELKVIIKSIVISSKGPIEVKDLLSYFKESEGRPLPYVAMGYTHVRDFLYDIKDIVKVLPDGTITATHSSETEHLVELIQKQRPAKKKPKKRPSLYQSRNYSQMLYNKQKSTYYSRNQSGTLARTRCSVSDSRTNPSNGRQRNSDMRPRSSYHNDNKYPSYNRNNGYDKQINSDYNSYTSKQNLVPDRYAFSSSSVSSLDSVDIVTSHRISEEADLHYKSVEPPVDLQEPQVSVTHVDYSASLTPQLKNNLKDIICEHPEGIRCSQLSQLVWEKYGAFLNFRKYGFSSIIELVDSIPNIFKIEDSKNNDWLLIDALRASTSELKNKNPSIPSKICDRIKEVSSTLTYPLTIQYFDRRYENMFHKSLSEEVEGFPNITSVLKSVDQNYIHLKEIDGDYYVLPIKQRLTHALEAGSDEDTDEINYPNFMLPLGGEVPPLEPFSDAITPTMEVKLGEIYGPHKFFMVSSYLMNAYSNLHKNIQSFYAQSAHLALTGLPVKIGLYCAAPYLEEWHRAIITGLFAQDQVMVFLIDFGTYLKLSKNEVRFLHESFASIPRLALRASLVDIIPPQNGEKYSKEANVLFYKLTAEKNLQAVIKSVDFTIQQRKYLVLLTDADKSVSEQLVAARVAEFRSPNLSNSKVSSASNTEPTSNVPSPCSGLLRSLEKLSLQGSSVENKETTAETVEKPKKSAGSILLNLLSSSKKTH